MAAPSLQAVATLMQPTKLGRQLRPVQGVGKAFGVEPSAARLTCSLHDFAQKCTDAAKIAGFALATSALVVSVSWFHKLARLLGYLNYAKYAVDCRMESSSAKVCPGLISIIHCMKFSHHLQLTPKEIYVPYKFVSDKQLP